jgi:hypothetical protein
MTERRSGGLVAFFLGAAAALGAGAAAAQGEAAPPEERGFFASLRDPEDGEFDLSEWLLDRKGFLPVPVVITEPAVGYGGGMALAFFRESIRDAVAKGGESGRLTPPDIFAGGVVGTENGTRGAAGGGMFSFADDRWRYRGGVLWTDARLDFFGAGEPVSGDARRIAYELEGWFSMQQALYRIGETNHFAALRWVYVDARSRLDPDVEQPESPELEFSTRASGLGPSWEYDSRDNIFTPNRGAIAALDTLFYREDFGGDGDFETYRGHLFHYRPLGPELVLGTRIDGRAARGDVPFYQLPFVDLRGIPAMRYQDENVAVAELELRWNLTARWALVAFGGDGRAWGRAGSFGDADDRFAGGVGVRYKVARRLGLYVGVDAARGPEEEAFYLQVGSGWR